MSTSEIDMGGFSAVGQSEASLPPARSSLHRIKAVRQEQGLSLRRVAQQMKMEIEDVRKEEDGEIDLPLSRLFAWQKVLDVPIADLLVDSDAPLSPPVLERARLVRLMKTIAAILEKTEAPAVRRLAQTAADQLKEIMPELEGITPWQEISERRLAGQLGRIAQQAHRLDTRRGFFTT